MNLYSCSFVTDDHKWGWLKTYHDCFTNMLGICKIVLRCSLKLQPAMLRSVWIKNKTNLRDMIAATGLVILLKLDSNRRFFSPCDLEIWRMTQKNNWATLLYYIKLCAWFQIHQWIQTGVTVQKHSVWVKIDDFFVPCEWCDLEIWQMTLKNNRAPLQCCCKLFAPFHSHWWIQTGVTVRKRPIWVKFDDFLSCMTCNLMHDLEKQ